MACCTLVGFLENMSYTSMCIFHQARFFAQVFSACLSEVLQVLSQVAYGHLVGSSHESMRAMWKRFEGLWDSVMEIQEVCSQ
jgi:hypothetical protein